MAHLLELLLSYDTVPTQRITLTPTKVIWLLLHAVSSLCIAGVKILQGGAASATALSDENWDDADFQNAVAFSALVVVWLVLWLIFYIRWIDKFYNPMTVVMDEFLGVFYREPQKLAAFNLLVSCILIMAVRLFGSFCNVWYADYYMEQFSSCCDPFNLKDSGECPISCHTLFIQNLTASHC